MLAISSIAILAAFAAFAEAAVLDPRKPKASPMAAKCMSEMDGMLPSYTPPGFNFSGNTRRYYMAAEIDTWDYAPTGYDNWLGVPINESFRAQVEGYIASNTSIGTKYDKALFKGYTDATFTEYTKQPPSAGFQGPILRAEVNDMIEIVLVNKMPDFYVSLHSMGLFYLKSSEGSLYPDGSSIPQGDVIPPGGCAVYKWLVGPASVPDEGLDSKLFSYHSYISMYQDTDAGLIGPVIIYNQGAMEKVMGENREFVVLYSDNQESNSFLALHNANKYLPGFKAENLTSEYPMPGSANMSYWYPQMTNSPKTNIDSTVAGSFTPMNGYMFANGPPFEMCLGDSVIWYLWNAGFEQHAVHWHGHNVELNGRLTAVVPIAPGSMATTPMSAVNPGTWHMICHVTDHLAGGMEAFYTVQTECTLPPLGKK
ncbi:Cupredoxin [Lipomyces tetrasporus]|uniref:Cupredoxin n=1 Tax=Lipomyces tetrasporus TaxID=54092 RepID=A0AAD7VP50_9ASCO|nr:Cupredoxin [Lipomyces tetrasporus]KAJ8096638.1 Cupredoxin [Lipomyces tetrasporus]